MILPDHYASDGVMMIFPALCSVLVEYLSKINLVPTSDTFLHGSPCSIDTILHHLMSCSAYRPSDLFNHWKFAVVMYYAKEKAIIKGKNVSDCYFP